MKDNLPTIGILGCGWLGLPLAKQWIARGITVKGTVTSTETISLLENNGIEAFAICLHPTHVFGDIKGFLKNTNVVLIAIPPKLRQGGAESFVEKITTVLPLLQASAIQHVVFISSTSVYGDQSGECTECTPPIPTTESGKQLLEVENILLATPQFTTTIIRFGGLIGPNRHPITHLASKKEVDNPNERIHFIHLEDCLGILEAVRVQQFPTGVFNAIAPYHPTRKSYYIQKAAERNLIPPTFIESDEPPFRKIISLRVATDLQYTFKQIPL